MEHASIWLWAASLAPLALLLFLMIARGWGAAEAGALGWLVASVTALTVFHLRLDAVGLQTVKGVVEAVTIVYVIEVSLRKPLSSGWGGIGLLRSRAGSGESPLGGSLSTTRIPADRHRLI